MLPRLPPRAGLAGSLALLLLGIARDALAGAHIRSYKDRRRAVLFCAALDHPNLLHDAEQPGGHVTARGHRLDVVVGGEMVMRLLRSKRRKHADQVLVLIGRALQEVHPDKFVSPLDITLVSQPRLALLNRLLGNKQTVSPVVFDQLVDRFSFFEQNGLLSTAIAAIGDDPVLNALAAAAMHQRHNSIKRDDIRQAAEQLLDFVCMRTA